MHFFTLLTCCAPKLSAFFLGGVTQIFLTFFPKESIQSLIIICTPRTRRISSQCTRTCSPNSSARENVGRRRVRRSINQSLIADRSGIQSPIRSSITGVGSRRFEPLPPIRVKINLKNMLRAVWFNKIYSL